MRRVLVIFLILLYPLNVFALSMSAASLAQPADAAERVHAPADAGLGDASGGATDCDGGCDIDFDIDPDEPHSGADLHYIVGQGGCLQAAGLGACAVALHDAAPRCHSIPPPVKPPRAA
jgi:hypothetical protein